MRKLPILAICVALLISVAGCSIVIQKRNPEDQKQIDTLTAELEKERSQREELLRARQELEERLQKEIEEEKIHLSMGDKGLVITFVAEVLFDAGKAAVRKDAYPILDNVAAVLNDRVSDRNIAIEGHTDNQPIRVSGWKSNWELSAARATSVLHYLIDNKRTEPHRLSAVGYGEYRPVASNDTKQGQQVNRRVEITILPEKMVKEKPASL